MIPVKNDNMCTTNNGIESLNGHFNSAQIEPQTIYSVIKGFQRDVEYSELILQEISAGTYRVIRKTR